MDARQVEVAGPRVVDGVSEAATDLGFSLDRAGDVDGDGFDDLIIGAPGVAAGSCAVGPERGRAYVLFGGPCGR